MGSSSHCLSKRFGYILQAIYSKHYALENTNTANGSDSSRTFFHKKSVFSARSTPLPDCCFPRNDRSRRSRRNIQKPLWPCVSSSRCFPIRSVLIEQCYRLLSGSSLYWYCERCFCRSLIFPLKISLLFCSPPASSGNTLCVTLWIKERSLAIFLFVRIIGRQLCKVFMRRTESRIGRCSYHVVSMNFKHCSFRLWRLWLEAGGICCYRLRSLTNTGDWWHICARNKFIYPCSTCRLYNMFKDFILLTVSNTQ